MMRKFLFEQSFDEPGNDSLSLMVFSEQEKENLKNQGFESGYARGFQEGMAASEQQKESMFVENIRKILETVTYQCDELEHQRYALAHLAAHMTTGILEKLFPLFVERLGGLEVEHFIERVLKDENPQELRIVAHPEICRFLQEKLLRDSKTPLRFEADSSFTVGDVRLFWQDRGVERIQGKLLAECAKLLEHLTPISEPPFVAHTKSPIDPLHSSM